MLTFTSLVVIETVFTPSIQTAREQLKCTVIRSVKEEHFCPGDRRHWSMHSPFNVKLIELFLSPPALTDHRRWGLDRFPEEAGRFGWFLPWVARLQRRVWYSWRWILAGTGQHSPSDQSGTDGAASRLERQDATICACSLHGLCGL